MCADIIHLFLRPRHTAPESGRVLSQWHTYYCHFHLASLGPSSWRTLWAEEKEAAAQPMLRRTCFRSTVVTASATLPGLTEMLPRFVIRSTESSVGKWIHFIFKVKKPTTQNLRCSHNNHFVITTINHETEKPKLQWDQRNPYTMFLNAKTNKQKAYVNLWDNTDDLFPLCSAAVQLTPTLGTCNTP